MHPSKLQRMTPTNPGQVIAKLEERIIRTTGRVTSPLAESISRKKSRRQVLVAVWYVRQTELFLPVPEVLIGIASLLLPVVHASVNVVQQRWSKGVGPTSPKHITPIRLVLEVREVTRQSGWTIRPGTIGF